MRHRTPPTIKPGMTEEEYQDEVADYLDACEGIHRAILDELKSNGIPANHAVAVVSLISTGSIPFVTVEY